MRPAVIFDLDGTLLDTLDDLMDALNHALTLCGHPVRTRGEVRTFVGNGIRKLVERGVPAGTAPEEVDRVFAAFQAHYRVHAQDKTAPYPGVAALLDRLKAAGAKMAIVTNKAAAAAVPLCAHFFPQVPVVVGERSELARKPAPDMVWAALDALGVTAAEAVYVGDSEVDLATARNSGLACLSVTWGFRDRELLLARGAAALADTPEALWELLGRVCV